MKTDIVDSLEKYLSILPATTNDVILCRGQSAKKKLLPSIARENPKRDTTDQEKIMLSELRRRGAMLIDRGLDDWELMILAQHFGMKTRLLDWTSNPLAALWFACINLDTKSSSYVYLLKPDKADFLDKVKHTSPFSASRTLVLKPTLNNPRIVAQNGWFTAHIFSKTPKKWVALNLNNLMHKKITQLEIPGNKKHVLLSKLDTFGMNSSSLFPGIEGVCRHINWIHP